MSYRIIYQLPNQPLSILIPSVCDLTLEEIGMKDIPAGAAFWVVATSTIPSDRTFRDAWELDIASLPEPSGYGTKKVEEDLL